MLCLSAFELYSRLVPLTDEQFYMCLSKSVPNGPYGVWVKFINNFFFFLFADKTPKSRLRVRVLSFTNCSSILEIIDYISESRLQR